MMSAQAVPSPQYATPAGLKNRCLRNKLIEAIPNMRFLWKCAAIADDFRRNLTPK